MYQLNSNVGEISVVLNHEYILQNLNMNKFSRILTHLNHIFPVYILWKEGKEVYSGGRYRHKIRRIFLFSLSMSPFEVKRNIKGDQSKLGRACALWAIIRAERALGGGGRGRGLRK